MQLRHAERVSQYLYSNSFNANSQVVYGFAAGGGV